MHTRRLICAGSAALAALALCAGSAGAAVLVDQVPSGSFTVPTVPSFDYPNPNAGARAADDFTVPKGQAWRVDAVDVIGLAQSGTSGTNTGNVALLRNEGGLPGAELHAQTGIGLAGGNCTVGSNCNFTAPLSGAPRLEPGSYWISVQTAGSYAWWWAVTPPGAPFGAPAVWQNPGDAFARGCPTYRTLLDCSWTTASEGQDLIFRLEGDLADSRFSLGSFSSNGRKIKLAASFPDPGKAKISGKNVKDDKVNVGSAGSKQLPIKPTKRARERLEDGDRVKLKVTVTFTATDGVPFKQKTSVKLVPVRAAGSGPSLRLGG